MPEDEPSGPPAGEEKRIFLAALELTDPAEREALIERRCDGDRSLQARVLALIEDASDDDTFLDPPPRRIEEILAEEADETIPLAPPTSFGKDHQPGDMIHRYTLLEKIGEGGFGIVWLAEQTKPVTRRVALKVIKLGMDTKEVIARFEAERQALAMMDDPNIATVFDAGSTENGRPFFVMELVKGLPITQYCDETGLGTRDRLSLFGDVCSAIQHAHQKGIIHRDIKPSNVMVSLNADRPVVKVIDFGIAKATQSKLTEKTLYTHQNQFVGTPIYMSPEQATSSAVDIDTRSDIYALGILLYELLTGKPPFDQKTLISAGYEEMMRIIREVDPPKPSFRLSTASGEEKSSRAKARRISPEKLIRLVERDLDWIVMKAIDKDRTRRYETANAFARDIEAFLADEPVSASPPSAIYQFRKFARRNRTALRVAAGIAIVLIAATAVSTWQAVRATREKAKAVQASAEAVASRIEAEAARAEAEDVAAYMTTVLKSPDPAIDGMTITVAECLDTAADEIETRFADNPDRRAKLQATLGSTYTSIGLHDRAVKLKEKVRDYHELRIGIEDPKTIKVRANLAAAYHDAGRLEESVQLQERVLEQIRRTHGAEHPMTLDHMSALATYIHWAGRREEALKMHEEILELRREAHGEEDSGTLASMTNLARSYRLLGRLDEAIALQEQALEIKRRVLGDQSSLTLSAISVMSMCYALANRNEEALELAKERLKLSREKFGPEHPDNTWMVDDLGLLYFKLGRHDEALAVREEALELHRKLDGPEAYETVAAIGNLVGSLHATKQFDRVTDLREESLAIHRKTDGPEHLFTLVAMHNLADAYRRDGRHEEAHTLLKQVLEARLRILGVGHRDTIFAMGTVASSFEQSQRSDRAQEQFEEMLAAARNFDDEKNFFKIWATDGLARIGHATDDLDEALNRSRESLQLHRDALGETHPETIGSMHRLAHAFETRGSDKDAQRLRDEIATLEAERDRDRED